MSHLFCNIETTLLLIGVSLDLTFFSNSFCLYDRLLCNRLLIYDSYLLVDLSIFHSSVLTKVEVFELFASCALVR